MSEEKKNGFLLTKFGLINIACLAVFVIPTMILLFYCIKTGQAVSKDIMYIWRPDYYTGLKGYRYMLSLTFVKLIYITTTCLMMFSYYRGYKILSVLKSLDSNQEKKVVREIFFWTLIFGLMLVFVAPFLSTDMYGYVNRGIEQAFYHLNPYIVTLQPLVSEWVL